MTNTKTKLDLGSKPNEVQVGVNKNLIVKAASRSGRSNATVLRRMKSPARKAFAGNYRKALDQHGYDMKKKKQQADHVTDLGFNGPDDYINLWPLKSTINMIPFQKSWYSRYKILYKKGNQSVLSKLSEMRKFYFIVKGFDKDPEKPGGRWAK